MVTTLLLTNGVKHMNKLAASLVGIVTNPAPLLAAALLAMSPLAQASDQKRCPTDRTREIGVRYQLEVEVLEPDDTHALKEGGLFDTVAEAVAEVERISLRGLCVLDDQPDSAGTCYPPARHIRTRLVKIYF